MFVKAFGSLTVLVSIASQMWNQSSYICPFILTPPKISPAIASVVQPTRRVSNATAAVRLVWWIKFDAPMIIGINVMLLHPVSLITYRLHFCS